MGKSLVVVKEIVNEIEIFKDICDWDMKCCGWDIKRNMWALHDTEFRVPSRDDNCQLANRQLFVLMILFGLIRPGIIGQLIERKWPTVVWHCRAQPFPFCNGNRIGVPSLEIAREGNCPLIMERDTVSNHIVKNRCLNAPWWHNASLGECEGWCGSIS